MTLALLTTQRMSMYLAWAIQVPLQRCGFFNPRSPRSVVSARCRKRNHWGAPKWAMETERALAADELAVAEATARVTHYMSQRDLSAVGTHELLAFCSVKGLAMPSNIWNRVGLEAAVNEYARQERLARMRKGREWDAMSPARKIRLLHDVCNGEGDVTYTDPESGYTVFTFFAHVKRGDCCGIKQREEAGEDGKFYERTHRCRHCPYTESGELNSSKMKAFMERVPVIELARQRAQELWVAENASMANVNLEAFVGRNGPSPKAQGARVASYPVSDNQQPKERHAKVVKLQTTNDKSHACEDCGDEKVVTCTRCNGFTYLFSPQLMKCPQCEANGYHPCMNCTPFRPPSRSSFYS